MFAKNAANAPCDFILFGALGDLACRKIIPALYQLESAGLLHERTRLIACSRETMAQGEFIDFVRLDLAQFLPIPIDETIWLRLSVKLAYCKLDVTQPADYNKILDFVQPEQVQVISYFAIPSYLYAQACEGLASAGLNLHSSRLVLEKPIGDNLASCQAINQQVGRYFAEDQIYRIDHYLGKETVLNLLVLRFANAIFSSNWDHRAIDRVEIIVAEELGVEGRWDYYDKSGHARDMLQNHLVQILSLVAMEPPLNLDAENIRHEKLKVLKSLRPINATNTNEYTVRGQYAANTINGRSIPGYLEEKGANQHSTTETFVAVKAYIDNWRWSGVPFYLLTGKKLSKKQSEVVIHFRPQAHQIFNTVDGSVAPNQLVIRLQPDEGVELRIMNKIPGLSQKMKLHESKLDLNFNRSFTNDRIADAYERLLLEIMQGSQSLFVSREEIELSWQWIDGIKSAWELENSPLHLYPSGTWGPEKVKLLFDGFAHLWEDKLEIS